MLYFFILFYFIFLSPGRSLFPECYCDDVLCWESKRDLIQIQCSRHDICRLPCLQAFTSREGEKRTDSMVYLEYSTATISQYMDDLVIHSLDDCALTTNWTPYSNPEIPR